MTKLKEDFRTQTEKFEKFNKQLARLSEKRKSSEALMANLIQEVEKLKESVQEIEKIKDALILL